MAYTNIDDPSAFFQTALYSGTAGANNAITNDGNSDLKPDWLLFKHRTASNQDWYAVDSSRGSTKGLATNTTAAETTSSSATKDFQSFNTDGFTVGTPEDTNATNSIGTHAAWQWKCNEGSTATNTSGTEDSVVQVNTDAGFSIVTATAPSSNGHWSFGHGLGVKPDMVITRQRSGGGWWTWHKDLTNQTTYYLGLNTDSAQTNEANMWGGGMTSSVVGVSSPNSTLANQTYVAYCFAEKQGYSKFGKYVGNAVVNGPFAFPLPTYLPNLL